MGPGGSHGGARPRGSPGGELTGKIRGYKLNAQTIERRVQILDYLRREFSEYQEDRPDVEDEDLEEED